jgi:hypothetical protein
MRNSFGIGILTILLAATSLQAQTAQRWEYLVLYFTGGAGTAITAVKDVPAAKLGDRQSYFGDRMFRYSDAPYPQAVLDELGSAGWELVAATPTTEQHAGNYVFKRPFDRARSQREAAEVQRLEKEASAAGTGTIPLPVKKEPLIDLDRADVKAADDAVAEKAKVRLEQAIKESGLGTLVNIRTFYNNYSKETSAELTIDGSAVLLKDGNKYRASEAQKYVSEIATELFKKSGLQLGKGADRYYFEGGGFNQRGEIQIVISVIVKYNGKNSQVGRGTIVADWATSNKQE